MKVKIIKKTEFELENREKHTHYQVAYKGRVFGVSTLSFPPAELIIAGEELQIKGELQLLQKPTTDPETGEIRNFVSIVPKLDLQLAEA